MDLGGSFFVTFDEAKSWFFDRNEWDQILDPLERHALTKVGAILMRTARGMIRRRKNPSRPDRPPTSWGSSKKGGQGALLKRFLFFFYEQITSSVIVGPIFLSGPHKGVYTIDRGTIPATLEFGGRERVAKAQITRFRGRNYFQPPNRIVTIKARPYMKPTLDKKLDKCVQVFEDILGRTPESIYVAERLRPGHAA